LTGGRAAGEDLRSKTGMAWRASSISANGAGERKMLSSNMKENIQYLSWLVACNQRNGLEAHSSAASQTGGKSLKLWHVSAFCMCLCRLSEGRLVWRHAAYGGAVADMA